MSLSISCSIKLCKLVFLTGLAESAIFIGLFWATGYCDTVIISLATLFDSARLGARRIYQTMQ